MGTETSDSINPAYEFALHGTGPRRQDQFVWFSGRGGYCGMRRLVYSK